MKNMDKGLSLNVSTTPITAIGCWQCLPLSVVRLKGKHCRKLNCRNEVVDTFGPLHVDINILHMHLVNFLGPKIVPMQCSIFYRSGCLIKLIIQLLTYNINICLRESLDRQFQNYGW